MKTTTLPALLLTLAVPLGLGLTACGTDADADQPSSSTASDSPSSDETASDQAEEGTGDVEGAGSFEPGSDEQVEAIRACLTDIGLPVADTPAPLRPEQRLSFGPVKGQLDHGFSGQVYVFDSAERAAEERPNVTFFDDDTEFDSLVGNVLVVYYPAPEKSGGYEAAIDGCLA